MKGIKKAIFPVIKIYNSFGKKFKKFDKFKILPNKIHI
jgi:hypothetical protein